MYFTQQFLNVFYSAAFKFIFLNSFLNTVYFKFHSDQQRFFTNINCYTAKTTQCYAVCNILYNCIMGSHTTQTALHVP